MGTYTEPWWNFRWMPPHAKALGRIWHLKIGPMMFTIYRLGKDPHWHFAARWVGTQTTTWMDGDCF